MSQVPVTLSLPKRLLNAVAQLQRQRQDPTRSDTVRVLLLERLAQLGYLTSEEARSLGVEKLAEIPTKTLAAAPLAKEPAG